MSSRMVLHFHRSENHTTIGRLNHVSDSSRPFFVQLLNVLPRFAVIQTTHDTSRKPSIRCVAEFIIPGPVTLRQVHEGSDDHTITRSETEPVRYSPGYSVVPKRADDRRTMFAPWSSLT